jgi:hypothetical protein
MSGQTLLQMTQNILSAMSSDEVNSISDTTESLQVANAIETVYNNFVGRSELPEHFQYFQLTASNNITTPTIMYVPNNCRRVDWIKYYSLDFGSIFFDQFGAYSHDLNLDLKNNSLGNITGQVTTATVSPSGTSVLYFSSTPSWVAIGQTVTDITYPAAIVGTITVTAIGSTTVNLSSNISGAGVGKGDTIGFTPIAVPLFYQDVQICTNDDFIDMINKFSPDDGDVYGYTFQGMNLRYKNDKKPQYCTIVQDYTVLFDSYDRIVDSTLQSSKTECYGQIVPAFKLVDDFIPDISDDVFPLLLNEAKSLAFYELKQTMHQKAEQEAKRQWSSLQRDKSVTNKPSYFGQLPNFGRQIGSGGYALRGRHIYRGQMESRGY